MTAVPSARWFTNPSVSRRLGYAGLSFLTLLVVAPLFGGGLEPYLDNPVHLAEIRALARHPDTGWVELGFAGFPLTVLQSPLLFPLLAWLTRLGVPLEPLYSAALVVALLAPSLALFHVAGKRVAPSWAFVLAVSLLVYRWSLVGSGAALAGMFGFHLASAAWLLLLDGLVQRERSLRHAALLATLTAFIGLVHMYVTIALVYLALVHGGACLLGDRPRLSRLRYDVPAIGLGAISAASYWMTNALAGTRASATPEPPLRILSRLFTANAPAPPPDAHRPLERLLSDPVYYLDALPQLAVALMAAVSLRRAWNARDDIGRYGALIAAVFLAVLMTQRLTHLPLLGPQGERLVYMVKLGLLMVALSFPDVLARARPGLDARAGKWGRFAAGAGALVCGLLANRVVTREAIHADDAQLTALRRVWAFMAEHRDASWGRVYCQGTFGLPQSGSLSRSHILAGTFDATGVEQIGEYYGNTPYELPWLYEPALADSSVHADEGLPSRLFALMERSNATHALLVEPETADAIVRDSRFQQMLRVGRFTLLVRRGALSRWAEATVGDVAIQREPGKLRVTPSPDVREVLIRESYHPFWRVTPADGARLAKREDGMMRLELRPHSPPIGLHFTPPRLPLSTTLLGVSGIGLLWIVARVRKGTKAAHSM